MNPIIDANWFNEKDCLVRFKNLIKQQDQALKDKFNPHHLVNDLLKEKSDFIDALLTASWQHFLSDQANKLSLLAVGGYGRRELFPHSDIDLMILLDADDVNLYQEGLTGFLTFLWDIGLKPGQGVRTVAECVAAATDDQTIMTSMMENRLIAGNALLYLKLRAEITPDKIWPSDQFFAAKIQEQQQRYLKYHDTAYNLEPNIKEGPGGLRDMQVISWVFKRHYNSATLRELIKYGFLPETEYNQLIGALNVLWRIRYALHVLTNRNEDRLIFDYQRDLAKQFGFSSENQKYNQDVEQFMQFYYKTVMQLQRLNEMLLQLFNERFLASTDNKLPQQLNDDFVVINQYLEAVDDAVFERNPLLLLNIFLILQNNAKLKGVRATTIRLIRKNLYLIDDDFRRNKAANSLFVEIFRQPDGITTQLRRMNRYGVLAAYLPAFANIVARMQYDLFHIYTVDEHTLFVIRNLRRFSLDKHRLELPLCNDIFNLIDKPEILYFAALFHDIAKGQSGDHSIIGEEIAKSFCTQHGISSQDSKLIVWLVRHHLVMSMTAQRKDIGDPDVIFEFAQKVVNVDYLNHLYLLTVADIRATNPELWNSWKDSLLKELYSATHSAIRRGMQNPVTLKERIEEHKSDAKEELLHMGFAMPELETFWQHIPDEYFLRYATDEIVWHNAAILNTRESELPLVMLRSQTRRGSAEIFVYAHNAGPIFAISTATLDQLGLTIIEARIMTTDNNYVLNSFQVLEQSGEAIKDSHRINHICAALKNNILLQEIKEHTNIHRQSRQAKHFPIPTDIRFHSDPLNKHTILELVTTDRSGLLSKISKVFNKLDINLHSARIATIGSRVEDMFYITDMALKPLTDEEKRVQLKNNLLLVLDNAKTKKTLTANSSK